MAYTRKCSVYLKCLYEHTKTNNCCHKPREQLLMAMLSHFNFFVQLLGSFFPALPVFCSSPPPAPSEFQCRLNPFPLNPFFLFPITCWALLLLVWQCWVEGLSPICCWIHIWWSLFQLRIFCQYPEYCHKHGTEGQIFNYTLLGLDSGRNNDKELSKLFKASHRSVWTYFGPACFIVANAVTMANLGLIMPKKGSFISVGQTYKLYKAGQVSSHSSVCCGSV